MSELKINDCWNTIGIWSNASERCEKLEKLLHCHNCDVFSNAGKLLLNREHDQHYLGEWKKNLAKPQQSFDDTSHSAMVFRLGDEWFALATECIREITYCDKFHSLPHTRDPVLRGLVNVRGDLILCISLGYLFGLHKAGAEAAQHKSISRYVVVEQDAYTYAFPVSEINNIIHFNLDQAEKPPATVEAASQRFTKGVLKLEPINIALLDEALVFHALERCV